MKTPSNLLRYAIAFGVVIVSLLSLRVITVADTPTVPSSTQSAHANTQINTSLLQLKRIGLGIEEYAVDNHHFPDAAQWVDEVLPYLIPKHLPPAERHQKVISLFHDLAAPAGQPWNYAYNIALSHLPLAKVRNPAGVVMAFESTKGVKNASDLGQSIPQPGWHHGLTCYLFVDGHAKAFGPQGRKLPFDPATPQPSTVTQKIRQQPSSTATSANQFAHIIQLQQARERAQQQFYVSIRSAQVLHEAAAKMKTGSVSAWEADQRPFIQTLQEQIADTQAQLSVRASRGLQRQPKDATAEAKLHGLQSELSSIYSHQNELKSYHNMIAFLIKQANLDEAKAASEHAMMTSLDSEIQALKRQK